MINVFITQEHFHFVIFYRTIAL